MEYLKGREWSAGNGQCPDCWGLAPDSGWEQRDKTLFDIGTELGADPNRKMITSTIGHKEGCVLAEAIKVVEELT